MLDTIFEDLYRINKSIDRMFDSRPSYRYYKWPQVNIYENHDDYVAVVKLPGIAKEDVSITLKENSLKIIGERKKENEEGINYYLDERYSGKFERNFILNEKIDSEKAEAEFKNGLLMIKLPKSPETKPKTISIK